MKDIKVLGTGCANCRHLEKMVRKAVDELKLDAVVSKEEDIMKIIGYGVRRAPGLVIDGTVVLSGQIPTEKELIELLTTQHVPDEKLDVTANPDDPSGLDAGPCPACGG